MGLIGLSHMKIPTFSDGMITHRDSALKSYSLPVKTEKNVRDS